MVNVSKGDVEYSGYKDLRLQQYGINVWEVLCEKLEEISRLMIHPEVRAREAAGKPLGLGF
ncbi:hypothetical protein E2C01_082326 [Portunus trituberculatus]|uniref:Uncharacterized protein n=1 Tax=Portunus trituberculatus TaxID=210409 RepID=A0A5B7J4M1_PORTR|nr:hypothetical protein [Portunus trituberculatus]